MLEDLDGFGYAAAYHAGSRRKQGCSRCASLEARLRVLAARVAALEAELARAKKHSGNSSKPPSSDIVNPAQKKNRGRRKGKIGGQPGHERHGREPFSREEIDREWIWYYCECPCCGGRLTQGPQPARVFQHVELLDIPIEKEEHSSYAQWCPRCERTFVAPFAEELRKAGLIGPRLTALVGFLKGACHMSFSTIRKFLRDVKFLADHPHAKSRACGALLVEDLRRLFGVIQTCGQQQRSVFAFLEAAATASFRSEAAPSLVPDTS